MAPASSTCILRGMEPRMTFLQTNRQPHEASYGLTPFMGIAIRPDSRPGP
jgi:hypothetical protein